MATLKKIPFHEIEIEVTRSRGPGGQNVNRTNSAVVMRWRPMDSQILSDFEKERVLGKISSKLTVKGELIVRSEEFRDQDENKRRGFEKLHDILADALFVHKPRRKTKPTKSSQRKRMDQKKHRATIKSGRGSKWD